MLFTRASGNFLDWSLARYCLIPYLNVYGNPVVVSVIDLGFSCEFMKEDVSRHL